MGKNKVFYTIKNPQYFRKDFKNLKIYDVKTSELFQLFASIPPTAPALSRLFRTPPQQPAHAARHPALARPVQSPCNTGGRLRRSYTHQLPPWATRSSLAVGVMLQRPRWAAVRGRKREAGGLR